MSLEDKALNLAKQRRLERELAAAKMEATENAKKVAVERAEKLAREFVDLAVKYGAAPRKLYAASGESPGLRLIGEVWQLRQYQESYYDTDAVPGIAIARNGEVMYVTTTSTGLVRQGSGSMWDEFMERDKFQGEKWEQLVVEVASQIAEKRLK